MPHMRQNIVADGPPLPRGSGASEFMESQSTLNKNDLAVRAPFSPGAVSKIQAPSNTVISIPQAFSRLVF